MKAPITTTQGVKGLVTTGMVALLVGCGGGGSGSSSSGSTDVVARGVITQLGSIYVNGVEWELPSNGTYSSDDDNPSGSDVAANLVYQVGQMVSIRGKRNDDGVTGTASEVEYEAEIEGVFNGSTINGVTILSTPSTNGPAMVSGTRYEVSGVWVDDSTLEATFIKVDDDGDSFDEIKGFVENDGPSSFDVRGITFGWTGTPDVSDGDFVEVHFDSCSGSSPNVTCTATSVELEDDYFDRAEGLEVEVEGAVDLDTTGCPAEAEFKVDGVCVDSDSKPAEWMDGLLSIDDLVPGTRVEAEGHMVAATPRDYLRADKVKGRGNRVRVSSIASNAGGNSFQLVGGNIDVTTIDGVTVFEDGLAIGDLDTDTEALKGIEVRGVRTGPSSLLAIRIKLDGLSGGGDRHEVRAEVDENGASTANSITVMGLTSTINSSTELEIEDVVIAPGNGVSPSGAEIAAFLGTIDDDSDASNGPRDIVEVGFKIGGGQPYTAEEVEIEEEDD